MAQRFDSKEAAEMLVEWASDYYHVGFSMDYDPANLTRMAFLNDDIVNSGKFRADFFPSSSLQETLTSSVIDNNRAEYLKEFVKWLLGNQPGKNDRVRDVEKVFDAEFEASESSTTKGAYRKLPLPQKARVIAENRSFKDNKVLSRRPPEFQIVIRMLKDGWPSITTSTRLWLPYTEDFSVFLKTLRQQTSLCRIPPREHSTPLDSRSAVPDNFSRVCKSRVRTLDEASQVTALQSIRTPNNGDVPTPATIGVHDAPRPTTLINNEPMSPATLVSSHCPYPAIIASAKRGSQKAGGPMQDIYPVHDMASNDGYTLEHGPWEYHIGRSPPNRDAVWSQISKQLDFIHMVEALKAANNMYQKEETFATIMHSIDRAVCKEWGHGGVEDGILRSVSWEGPINEDEGEPYLDYMMRKAGLPYYPTR